MSDPATPAPTASPTLADRVRKDVETLGRELAEIELLVQQAKVEAGRHETKRAQASERLETLTKQIPSADPKEIAEQGASLANLTRRAVLMEAQVEVLEGEEAFDPPHVRPGTGGAAISHRVPAGAATLRVGRAGGWAGARPSDEDVPGRRPHPGPSTQRGRPDRCLARRTPVTCRVRIRCVEPPAGPLLVQHRRGPVRTRSRRSPKSGSSSGWSRARSRPRRGSSSTSARWSLTTWGSCRPFVVRPVSADGGPRSRWSSNHSGLIVGSRWSSRVASSGSSTRRWPRSCRAPRTACRSASTGATTRWRRRSVPIGRFRMRAPPSSNRRHRNRNGARASRPSCPRRSPR